MVMLIAPVNVTRPQGCLHLQMPIIALARLEDSAEHPKVSFIQVELSRGGGINNEPLSHLFFKKPQSFYKTVTNRTGRHWSQIGNLVGRLDFELLLLKAVTIGARMRALFT